MDEKRRQMPRFFKLARWLCAFTHSYAEKDALIAYIIGQEEHHKKTSFEDELKKLLTEAGVEYDERYLR